MPTKNERVVRVRGKNGGREALTAQKEERGAAARTSGANTRLFVLVGALLLVAGFFRFHDLQNAPPGLHCDEAADAIDAAEAARTGQFQIFYPGNHGREGLFINTGAILQSAMSIVEPAPLHIEAWIARFPSALFGTLTVLGIFFVVRLLGASDFAAAAAAFFTAISLWDLCLSRLGTRAASSNCFLVWALVVLLWGFAKNAGFAGRFQWMLLALAGAIYGAGFHTYTAYRITPMIVIGFLAWLAWAYRSDGRLRVWFAGTGLFLGMAILVFSPLALYFLRHPAEFSSRTSEVSIMGSPHFWEELGSNLEKTALMFNVAGDRNPRHNIPGRPELFFPIGLLFLGGVGLGVFCVLRRRANSWPFVLCFLWAAAGALPAVLSNEGMPHALRSCLMIPPCFILAALFGDQVRLWVAPRLPRYVWAGAVAAIVLLLGVEGYISYFHRFARDLRTRVEFQGGEADMARQIGAMPEWVPKYFVLIGVPLDERGNPEGHEEIALLSGGYTPTDRTKRNIHFVTTLPEAERVRHIQGAVVAVP